MKNPCGKYTFDEINQFTDDELGPEKHSEMQAHILQCPDCRQAVKTLQAISGAFARRVDRQIELTDPSAVQARLSTFFEKKAPQYHGFPAFFTGCSRCLRFTLAGMVLVAGLFVFNTYRTAIPGGPSAIVKSVDTEFSSVMIIETQKEKHTIIWFSES